MDVRYDARTMPVPLQGSRWLLVALHYQVGLELEACVRLRVRDLDFPRRCLIVRAADGVRGRAVPLPARLLRPLQEQLGKVRALYERDLAEGYGEAWLPPTLASRSPWAARQWGWQYVFPSARRLTDPRDGVCRRPHIDIATVRRLLDAIAGEGRPVPGGTGRAVRAG